jgi:hypothetical protein
LPNPLRMFSYARGGGVSRVAKGADCKSGQLSIPFNGHSEDSAEFALKAINRLAAISERRGVIELPPVGKPTLRAARISRMRATGHMIDPIANRQPFVSSLQGIRWPTSVSTGAHEILPASHF